MNRVSTSTRADSPGCAGTARSVKIPPTAGFFSAASVAGSAGDSDEVRAGTARVGPDVQRAAGAGGYRGARRGRGNRVPERDDDGVLVGPDEQPVLAGLEPVDRQRRHHQPAVGGQRGDRGARDGDVQRPRCSGHQRRGDVADVAVGVEALRPQDGRRCLFDRKQRDHHAQQGTGDSRDDRDQSGEPMRRSLAVVEGHEARSYATLARAPTIQPARRAEEEAANLIGR